MGFLFNLFLFFALFEGEGRLSLSQNNFSQLSETSVRCLDPNSGEEVTDEKVELGVSCIAEIKSEKGISYQYLHPKMSIDWDALNFNDVGIVVTPERTKLVMAEPLKLQVSITAPNGIPSGSELFFKAPRGVKLNNEDSRISLPNLNPGEVHLIELNLKNYDPTQHGSKSLEMFVSTPQGTIISNTSNVNIQVLPDRLFSLGMISGKVWLDENEDHFYDDDEGAVEGLVLRFENGTTVKTDKNGRFHIDGLAPGSRVVEVLSGVPQGWKPSFGFDIQSVLVLPGGLANLNIPLVKTDKQWSRKTGFGAIGSLSFGNSSSSMEGSFRYISNYAGLNMELAYSEGLRDWNDRAINRNQALDLSRHNYLFSDSSTSSHSYGSGFSWNVSSSNANVRYGNVRARDTSLAFARHDLSFEGYEANWSKNNTSVTSTLSEHPVQKTKDIFKNNNNGFVYRLRNVERKENSIQVYLDVNRFDGSFGGSWKLDDSIHYVHEDGTIRLLYPLSDIAQEKYGHINGEELLLRVSYDWILEEVDGGTWTTKVKHNLGNGWKFGVTKVNEARQLGDYQLEGHNVSFNHSDFSFGYQKARTKSSDTGEYISEDGGVTFDYVDTLDGDWSQSDKFNASLNAGSLGSFSYSNSNMQKGFSSKDVWVGQDKKVTEIGFNNSDFLGFFGASAYFYNEKHSLSQNSYKRSKIDLSKNLEGFGHLTFSKESRVDPNLREEKLNTYLNKDLGNGLSFQFRNTNVLKAENSGIVDEREFKFFGSSSKGNWNLRKLENSYQHYSELNIKGNFFTKNLDLKISRDVRSNWENPKHKLQMFKYEKSIDGALSVSVTDVIEEQGKWVDLREDLNLNWKPNSSNTINANIVLTGNEVSDDQWEGYNLGGNHSLYGWDVSWGANQYLNPFNNNHRHKTLESRITKSLSNATRYSFTTDRKRETSLDNTLKEYTKLASSLVWSPSKNLSLSGSALEIRDDGWTEFSNHNIQTYSLSWQPNALSFTGRYSLRDSSNHVGEENVAIKSLRVGYQYKDWNFSAEDRLMYGDITESGYRFEIGRLITDGLRVIVGYSDGGADDMFLTPDGHNGLYLRFSGAF